ncbi:bifunctional [glutamate--ammonia ligase]-adenylyl-L-tyrosine phosphorylase/[glutamate--ammonia-ligase] adenylyltransferase [Sphingomonas sp. ID1715]|uniref:bifunctional [glutamate--ammonia ligase]-adenylyl-L-tyrosine phosphorylase/[glutamate--ammonia-ligase] adenylyltransferase n=1 Tax=Sphingomonas sp. ID1715 TaxID=1656898 RepID=UPI001489BA5F|nr:bifunctional [glutamate--ammonia ligase]-adenylyl-L-tyrosine phosphorylase/[glutamate--ammonia-ligase] adenylyltransferase [Sphingomonas sp. ID1715]NNM76950.1 bifunctional [glutamate--ammonia ligase]-adenylyl-L-tyrosine phosphorylase/[glutamate--ammonia-ligase] adenylyltransferase [Sphingomonas sp. ID1715]
MNATPSAALSEALERAARHAPFLRGQIERHSDLADLLSAGDLTDALAASEVLAEDLPTARRLRLVRSRTALVLAIGDLAGALSLEDVTQRLSDLADRSLDIAIATAVEERVQGADPRGFAVIALGKHGGRELNYSSDIDPIFLYDPEVLPHRGREEAAEAAVRIGRRIIELLQARDEDGYAFRVDLRLRPSPEVTPIALPVDAAIGYYESSAVAWERAAFVRARAAAGDRELGETFLDAIRPFVWRRSLDFGAVKEMRAMSHRIRDRHGREAFGPGYDLKRGRGGIREVEFFAQIHQLIHGGRDRSLRSPATVPALTSLRAAGIIGEEAEQLIDAYRLFRTIEHRLQMVDDRQTHQLPADRAALDNVAALHGLCGGAELIDLLRPHLAAVGTLYDGLDDGSEAGVPVGEALIGALGRAGFANPEPARAVIERWRGGGVRALQSPAAREALEEVLPRLVAALGQAPDPLGALHRLDDIVGKLPSAINFFRLLAARPPLARLLADILTHAPTLAAALGSRPSLLDGLIDATAFEPAPPVAELVRSFSAAESGDYERLLDHVRHAVGERRFALGTQLIEGASDPLDVAAGYARVAEAAVQALAAATVDDHRRQHGDVPDSEFVVLALGRLGGAALTHASDLDLIYLFTGTLDRSSDGAKPLEATRYYNRLAQRVTAALTVPTAAGALYEVDTRLRPSGAKGLLAVTLDSFADYQRTSAWTWEHMALTRARPIFGSEEARAAVQAIIDDVLRQPRPKLLADVAAMRSDMARHKPPAGPLDAKLIAGGLVDLEFCVHATQLEQGAGLDPHLPTAIAQLVAAGLLPDGFAEAHDVLTRLLVTLRLVAPDAQEPPAPTRALVARACGFGDWDALLEGYALARQRVSEHWARIVARSREGQ